MNHETLLRELVKLLPTYLETVLHKYIAHETIYGWSLGSSPSRFSERALETPITHSEKALETPIKPSEKALETSIKHSEKALETSIKHSEKALETPIKHFEKALETPSKHSEKGLETTSILRKPRKTPRQRFLKEFSNLLSKICCESPGIPSPRCL